MLKNLFFLLWFLFDGTNLLESLLETSWPVLLWWSMMGDVDLIQDKDTILKKSGVIYKYSCGRVDCGEEYIGESGRTFGERYREHMRSTSPIMDHHNNTGHEVSLDNFTIVGREDNNIARNIREAIFIRVNDPSLNRNIGKFQLPHIWDEVLARSPELHLK